MARKLTPPIPVMNVMSNYLVAVLPAQEVFNVAPIFINPRLVIGGWGAPPKVVNPRKYLPIKHRLVD